MGSNVTQRGAKFLESVSAGIWRVTGISPLVSLAAFLTAAGISCKDIRVLSFSEALRIYPPFAVRVATRNASSLESLCFSSASANATSNGERRERTMIITYPLVTSSARPVLCSLSPPFSAGLPALHNGVSRREWETA